MAGRPGGCDPTRGAPRAHNSFLNSPLSPFAAFRHPCRNMPNIHRNVLVAAHCDVGVSWAALWPQSGGFCAGVLVPAVPEAVGRRRARLCGSPGTWRLLHRRCPPPTTRPTPTCGAPTCETRRCSSNDEADPASYIASGRGGRLVEQSRSGSIGTMLSSRGFV